MSNLSIMFSSQTDEWATPQEFFDKLNKEFHFTLDPCALPSNAKCKRYFTPADNGLLQNWGGKLCSVIRRMVVLFMIGCVNAVRRRKPNTTVVALIPARTDTKYFHEFIYHKAKEIRFVKGRLKFGGSRNAAPFPSMVVIF